MRGWSDCGPIIIVVADKDTQSPVIHLMMADDVVWRIYNIFVVPCNTHTG